VKLVTDAEATKTSGLAEKLLAEKDHPAADVYWGNEPFSTINLSDAGVLAPYPRYHPPGTDQIADRFHDPSNIYTSSRSARPDDRNLQAPGIRRPDLTD